jgi:hypothetical protein
MKIERLKLNVGLTINMGNFESARVDVGGEVTLDSGDSVEEAWKLLEDVCDEEMLKQTKGIESKAKERFKGGSDKRKGDTG